MTLLRIVNIIFFSNTFIFRRELFTSRYNFILCNNVAYSSLRHRSNNWKLFYMSDLSNESEGFIRFLNNTNCYHCEHVFGTIYREKIPTNHINKLKGKSLSYTLSRLRAREISQCTSKKAPSLRSCPTPKLIK